MEYGLIGAKLGHSYSKEIHEALCDYTYTLCPLPEKEQVAQLLREKAFRAINVTIPYKQYVMQFCDEIDPAAQTIGAVNTIVNRGGRLFAYNTDYAGFACLLRTYGMQPQGKVCMILGTGGTQHTVEAVLRHSGAAEVLCVSHSGAGGALTYEQAARRRDVQLLVNTTPVGMYPDTGVCLVDLADWPLLEGVLDAVYNPFETALLRAARERGISHGDGLVMLVAQAKAAAEHFTGQTIDDGEVMRVAGDIFARRANLVLIGMPSCGKTSLGRAAAQQLGKTFVDLDAAVEAKDGRRIADIFAQDGETAFRDAETAICAAYGKESGQVLATGGGAVLRAENVALLRQNGLLVFVDRPLDALAVGGARPLSTGRDALAAMEQTRRPLYQAAAQATVNNDGAFANTLQQLTEVFYETAHHQWA